MNEAVIKFKKSIFTVDTFDDAGESVLAEIFKYREYRRADEVIISARSEEYIVDAGAHLGFFALYARALNPSVKIVCLEPNEKNFLILQDNISRNNVKKIIELNIGLAPESGKRNFSISNDSHDSKMIGDRGDSFDEFYSKQTKSLADLITSHKIKKIALLKMDIEGVEFEIIKKTNDDVYESISNIIMEYHDYAKDSHRIIEKILRQKGFSVEIFPSKFEKKLGFIFARNKRIKK